MPIISAHFWLPDGEPRGRSFAPRLISRRQALQTFLLTGLSLAGVNAIAPDAVLAQTDTPFSPTFYPWILNLHPSLGSFNRKFMGLEGKVGNVANNDYFIGQARKGKSDWDVYVGATPFVDLGSLIAADVIEPWEAYIPKDMLDDILPRVREECTVDGKLYSWPFLLDVVVLGWNSGNLRQAGLYGAAPTTWTGLIASAARVVAGGVTSYGCTFDPKGWRSLAPVAHSYSNQVYYKLDGDPSAEMLFDFTRPPAIEALVVLKRMYDLAPENTLADQPPDGGPARAAWAARSTAFNLSYHNALLRYSTQWPDPAQMRMGAMPRPPGGAGSTVFWSTGAVLLKHGRNKEKAAEYIAALTHDAQIWQDSIAGTPSGHIGQLPPYASLYDDWKANPPEWLAGQDWLDVVRGQLDVAKAIPNHPFGASQFTIAKPYWEKYLTGEEADPRVAMKNAKDAVAATVLATS